MKSFFVYMLRCRDGSYYVGHTDDLEHRMEAHASGAFGGTTARKRPVVLVWAMELATRAEALEREMQLKRWTRAKKEALVREDWPELKRLARGPDRGDRELERRAPFDSAPDQPRRSPDGRYAQGERMGSTAGCGACHERGRRAQNERMGGTDEAGEGVEADRD